MPSSTVIAGHADGASRDASLPDYVDALLAAAHYLTPEERERLGHAWQVGAAAELVANDDDMKGDD